MKEKFKKIQEKLDKKSKLYLEDYVFDNKLSLKEFIELLLVKLNNSYDTFKINKSDKKCIQTCRDSNRSAGDIYRITKTYFPSTTYEEVFLVLVSFDNLVGMFCTDICKQVYRLVDKRDGTGYYWKLYYPKNRGRRDEFDIKLTEFFEKKEYLSN